MSLTPFAVCTALLLALAAACTDNAPVPTASDVVLAKGGVGGGGGGGVAVSAAKPDTGSQSTTLDVTISGSGFTSNMTATWELDGAADELQVRTNSTRFVSSKQLVANITIGAEATAAKWDIRVAGGDGKGGIGTELFTVKVNPGTDTDPRVLSEFEEEVNIAPEGQAPNFQPAGIGGDGRNEFGLSATVSRYQGNYCGVDSRLFMSNGGGDLILYPDANYSSGKMAVCGAKRSLRIFLDYQPGARGKATSFGALHNTRGAGLLAPGESRSQAMGFGGLTVKGCERVNFNTELHSGASYGRVTRLADAPSGARRWRVQSEYPHKAVCMATKKGSLEPTGELKYLPFAYTATEVPFPYPSYP